MNLLDKYVPKGVDQPDAIRGMRAHVNLNHFAESLSTVEKITSMPLLEVQVALAQLKDAGVDFPTNTKVALIGRFAKDAAMKRPSKTNGHVAELLEVIEP